MVCAPSATSFLPVAKKNVATPFSYTTRALSAATGAGAEASDAAAGALATSASASDTAEAAGSDAAGAAACSPLPQLLKASRANTAATASAIHLPLPPFLAAAVAAAAPPATAAPALPKPLKRLFKPPKMPLRLPMPKADSILLSSTCESQPCCWASRPSNWPWFKLPSLAWPRNTDSTKGRASDSKEPADALDTPLCCEI